MPAYQALTGLIETAINQALEISLNAAELLAPLDAKRCIVFLQEFDLTLAFQFSGQRVDVLSLPAYDEDALDALADNEAFISVSLFALPELKKTSQLTKLIKQNKLDFYGDLAVVQKFSQLLSDIEFDFEETLSAYIGDAGAYTLIKQSKLLKAHAKQQHELLMNMLKDAALEEKPIAVRPIMVANFVDEVRQLKTDTERLEARINMIIERRNAK